MKEAFGDVGRGQDQQKCHQAADDVEAVEAGGEVKGRAIGVGRKREALKDKFGVLGDLTADKHRTHEESDDEPAA